MDFIQILDAVNCVETVSYLAEQISHVCTDLESLHGGNNPLIPYEPICRLPTI